jgi:hypothetical protein
MLTPSDDLGLQLVVAKLLCIVLLIGLHLFVQHGVLHQAAVD